MATTLGQDQQGHTVQVQHGVELAGQIVSCVLEGNDESMRRPGDARECSVSCCEVVLCVVQVLKDLTDQEATWHSVNRVLDISTRKQLHNHQDQTFLYLTTLCYPADQLISLTSKVTILSPSPNYQSYLTMLEQTLENLAEADQDQVPWTDPGLMDKETDRDSSLASSEAE
jgi:hypothetical protein